MEEEKHLERIRKMMKEKKKPIEIMEEIKRIEKDELPKPHERTGYHKEFLKKLKEIQKILEKKV